MTVNRILTYNKFICSLLSLILNEVYSGACGSKPTTVGPLLYYNMVKTR